jgi:hypothetical protein
MCISVAEMTAPAWAVKRFLPVLLVTAGVATGLAYFRASGVFLIGFQGMFAGGMLGWMAGRLGRKDPGAYWSFNQRCWLGVSMMVVYSVMHLVALSMLKAGPVDTPLYWIEEVMQGFQGEEFLSSGRFQVHEGKIEGGWWIFMNLLDAGLFWFLFIAFCVVGVCPDKAEEQEDSSSTEEDLVSPETNSVDEDEEAVAMLQPCSNVAFYAMLSVLAGVLICGGLYWKMVNGPPAQMTYSAGIAAMKKYEGQWEFKKGLGMLSEETEARSFTITALGRNGLLLKNVVDGYTLSLNQDGRLFSGLLFMTREGGRLGQFSARVQFTPQRNHLTMSVVNFEVGGRRDIVLEADKLQ